MRALYESAFPENERRSLDGMLREKSGALKLLSFFEEERFIGLYAYMPQEQDFKPIKLFI